MIAVIMAGGLGTRLRPLTYSIPKPLLPVGEKPILEVIIQKLKSHGIRDIFLTTGYRSELIQTYFRDGAKFGVRITYVNEQQPLGTAGALALLPRKKLGRQPFIVMNGDILTKLDFRKMREFHSKQRAVLTIGTKQYEHQLPFGTLDVRAGEVLSIREKPTFSHLISAGIYMMQPEALDEIPKRKFFTIPDLTQRLIDERKKVASYLIREYWIGVERLDQFNEALKNKQRWV